MSTWLVAGGLLVGAIAAATGIADFLGSARVRALHHAWYHLIGNACVLTFRGGLLLSAATVALLIFTGWHGGEMVFGHDVGMSRHEHRPGHHETRQEH